MGIGSQVAPPAPQHERVQSRRGSSPGGCSQFLGDGNFGRRERCEQVVADVRPILQQQPVLLRLNDGRRLLLGFLQPRLLREVTARSGRVG